MKKLVALLVTAVFLLAWLPSAMAMPAATSHPTPMSAADCMSRMSMPGDHFTPIQKQNTPCKDMSKCLGMTGGMTFAAIAQRTVGVWQPKLVSTKHWQESGVGHGITVRPDNPPPIA